MEVTILEEAQASLILWAKHPLTKAGAQCS